MQKTDFNGLTITHPATGPQLTEKQITKVLRNELGLRNLSNGKTVAKNAKEKGYTGFVIERQGAGFIINEKIK